MVRACAIKRAIVPANLPCFSCCVAVLVNCSVRLDTDSPVHTLSDSLTIYFFPLWRADLKISGFVAEFAGCVWTVAVSGNKKLQIQKYPDASKHHIIHLDK